MSSKLFLCIGGDYYCEISIFKEMQLSFHRMNECNCSFLLLSMKMVIIIVKFLG